MSVARARARACLRINSLSHKPWCVCLRSFYIRSRHLADLYARICVCAFIVYARWIIIYICTSIYLSPGFANFFLRYQSWPSRFHLSFYLNTCQIPRQPATITITYRSLLNLSCRPLCPRILCVSRCRRSQDRNLANRVRVFRKAVKWRRESSPHRFGARLFFSPICLLRTRNGHACVYASCY